MNGVRNLIIASSTRSVQVEMLAVGDNMPCLTDADLLWSLRMINEYAINFVILS